MFFTAGRIALFQLAAVVIVFSAVIAGPAAALVGCLLLAAGAIRVRGRRPDQWLMGYLTYRRRHRSSRAASPLESVAPGLATASFSDRAGNRIGLVADGPAWTAMLRLELDGTARHHELLGWLTAALRDGDGIRLAATQLVRWAVPRPSDPDHHTAGAGWDVYWIAARFDPAADPAAVAARGGGTAGAMRAAGVAALRLCFQLRQRGFAIRPLEETELPAELASTLGGQGDAKVRETWRAWSAGALHHAAFRVTRPGDPAAVLAWQARPPALTTATALLMSTSDRGPRLTATVRVAVPADRNNRRALAGVLRQATQGMGLPAKPMNGRHGAGVSATIPLGR